MDADKLHKMLKPLPNDFDDFLRNGFRFSGAWTGYVGTVYPEAQFMEEAKPEKMLYCTQCHTYTPTDIKLGSKYSGDTNPRRYTICPYCNESISLFSLRKKTTPTERHQTYWIGQNLGEKIFVLRGFRVTLRLYSPEVFENEEIIKQEIRRLYISPDDSYKEYCGWGYDYTTDKYIPDQWAPRAAGFASASGPIYPDTFEEAIGTGAEYAHFQDAKEEEIFTDEGNWDDRWGTSGSYYAATNNRDSIWDYLSVYANNRRTEMLVKLNMPYLVRTQMQGYAIHVNGRAKNPWDYLHIYKSRLKGFSCTGGDDYDTLKVYRLERRLKLQFTDEEVNTLKGFIYRESVVKDCLKYMTIRQLINRVNNYYKKKVGYTKTDVLTTYSDYLSMKEELGYDMTNSIILHPKDLKAEHDKAVIERNKAAAKRREEAANEMYKGISARFKRANKVYYYSSGKLFVRPAKNAAEIIEEGRTLHHCVGGDDYLEAHAKKESIILFLRKKEDTPYITIEMLPTGKIVQWYGAYDKKPDEAKIDRWLNKYVKQLDVKALKREAKQKGA